VHILKLCVLINFLFLLPVNAQENYFDNHLDHLLPQLIEHNGVAGIAVGVTENGKISIKKTMGFADIEKKKPVNDRTVFNVGSISKPMTAWGIMHLVRTGRLSLDEPGK
jgi:CubicO group peptidase (beta-lactamase class C family)